jgi:multidrug transporter EmrE-like cation transporter
LAYLDDRRRLHDTVGFVVAASIAFGLGGVLMKLAAGLHSLWPTIGVAVLFVVGGLLLGHAVRSEGLSVAYIAGLGIEAIVSVGLGRYLFDERLTTPQAIGLVLIAAGVVSVRFG